MGAVIAGSFRFLRRVGIKQAGRNVVLWFGVVVIVALAYMLKDPFNSTLLRMRAEMVPGYAAQTGAHELTINADEDGDFDVFGQVNGATVRFTVDTGASEIVLSPADAKRAGINTAALIYSSEYETANGTGHGAAVILGKLAIGPIVFFNVPAAVDQTAMHSSLLGMTFLRRIQSFEFAKDKLVLRY
jgi:aspartyl protease family protein